MMIIIVVVDLLWSDEQSTRNIMEKRTFQKSNYYIIIIIIIKKKTKNKNKVDTTVLLRKRKQGERERERNQLHQARNARAAEQQPTNNRLLIICMKVPSLNPLPIHHQTVPDINYHHHQRTNE